MNRFTIGYVGDYAAILNGNELVCLLGHRESYDRGKALRLLLALELVDEVPTEVLLEIYERQPSREKRVAILQHVRAFWHAAQRVQTPLRHVQPEL